VTAACDDVSEAFFAALEGLGPVDLRVLYLAMSRAASLEAAGRGADADTLLLGLLRLVQEEPRHALGESGYL
jgi:hypothetical protein